MHETKEHITIIFYVHTRTQTHIKNCIQWNRLCLYAHIPLLMLYFVITLVDLQIKLDKNKAISKNTNLILRLIGFFKIVRLVCA